MSDSDSYNFTSPQWLQWGARAEGIVTTGGLKDAVGKRLGGSSDEAGAEVPTRGSRGGLRERGAMGSRKIKQRKLRELY